MRRGMLLPLTAIAIAFMILIGLGTWQLQRLTWKLGLIEQIASRVKAQPLPIAEAERRLAAAEDINYLRITARGQFDHSREAHLYAPGEQRWGWHILTPLMLADGRELLVNRGFVPDAQKSPDRRRAGLVSGLVEVTGLVQVPDPRQPNFVPDNEPGRNRWYWLDPAALTSPPRLPFVLEAEATPGQVPAGGATRLEINNPHLGYAATWYALAATLAVMSAAWLLGRWRTSTTSGRRH